MTPRQAIAYIESRGWSKTRLGLGRTRALLAALGDPQKSLRFVHVAGSNGKGSVCAMLESILRRAGYRVGLYTSPYIEDFCERIQVDRENIPGPDLASVTEEVAAAAEGMDDHPSQFELVTAAAMVYFRRRACDIVVLEVGMGGALDSTNVIDPPEAAVITNIGLEHTEYLGSTLEEIARTKAGIIKPGCGCVCYDGASEVTAVVREVCEKMGADFVRAEFQCLTPLCQSLEGQRFTYRGREYALSLSGPHQLRNAAVALETVGLLRRRGWTIPDAAVADGLRDARWPARFEVLSRKPLFILDGGHNPQCAEALAESLRALLPGRRAVFLTGVLRDKDYPRIMRTILPLARSFVCLTPQSDRALPGPELAAFLRSGGAEARACPTAAEGIGLALTAAGEDGVVVAFGSLYLAGAVRGAYPAALRAWLRGVKRASRERLAEDERAALSARIVEHIRRSPEFQRARTVMLYRAVGAEVSLDALADGEKRFVYPVCGRGGHMEAMAPLSPEAWRAGPFGIPEPDPARAELVDPRGIDLVLCPCTAFDEGGHRLGAGGGYYDRFLPRCGNAVAAAVAFGVQKAEKLPAEPWDRKVSLVFTESGAYRCLREPE